MSLSELTHLLIPFASSVLLTHGVTTVTVVVPHLEMQFMKHILEAQMNAVSGAVLTPLPPSPPLAFAFPQLVDLIPPPPPPPFSLTRKMTW